MWAFSDPTPRSTEHSLSLNSEWFISSISCYSLFRWLVGVWMRTDVSHFWPVHLLTRTFTSTRVVFFNAITASFFFVLLCFTATSFLCRNRLYRIISALSWTRRCWQSFYLCRRWDVASPRCWTSNHFFPQFAVTLINWLADWMASTTSVPSVHNKRSHIK